MRFSVPHGDRHRICTVSLTDRDRSAGRAVDTPEVGELLAADARLVVSIAEGAHLETSFDWPVRRRLRPALREPRL